MLHDMAQPGLAIRSSLQLRIGTVCIYGGKEEESKPPRLHFTPRNGSSPAANAVLDFMSNGHGLR